jgi:hypothetical protein
MPTLETVNEARRDIRAVIQKTHCNVRAGDGGLFGALPRSSAAIWNVEQHAC